MVWANLSYSGVGPISLIDEIMDQHVYVNILRNVILSYTDDEMSLIWTFQQDNDPKHTIKLATPTFSQKQIDVLPCPAQSPDLNPIENLSRDISVLLSRNPRLLSRSFGKLCRRDGVRFPANVARTWGTPCHVGVSL